MDLIAKLYCRFFGHKQPFLYSKDKMRYICARCGFRTFSITALQEYLKMTDLSAGTLIRVPKGFLNLLAKAGEGVLTRANNEMYLV